MAHLSLFSSLSFVAPRFLWRFSAHLSAIVLAAGLAVSSEPAQAAAVTAGKLSRPAQKVVLVPHRAVYDMALDESRTGSGVGGVLGRLVLEFTGSSCDGYTLNTRLVTQITDRKGNTTTSDLRSSTFEHEQGKSFRFATTQYLDQKRGELTFGKAVRNDDNDIALRLTRPKKLQLDLSRDVMFPTQHSRVVLRAALAGRSLVEADIYDGSEQGNKVFLTSTFIGKLVPPKTIGTKASSAPATALSKTDSADPEHPDKTLEKLKSWPVIISYYDRTATSKDAVEGVPSYELAYQLFSNGVSRDLTINYGDFSITGKLSYLKTLPVSACK